MTTPLILKGDRKDSNRKFQDSLREMTTRNNMILFLNDDIDAEEPFSTAESTKFKQQQLVGNMLLELIQLADPTSELRNTVRSIEKSEAFSTPVQKMRKIIKLYEDVTAPNPEKNSYLKSERSAISFHSHGTIELRRDVDILLNKITTIEEEMQDAFKWNTTQKIEKIMNLLHDVKELNTFFEQTKTYDTATTFDLFRTGLLQACNGIADRERNQRRQIMSANSTQGNVEEHVSSNSTHSIEDKSLFEDFQAWRNGNATRRDSSSQRGRTRERSTSRDRPRGRSNSRDRNRYRGYGGYNRRSNSRDRYRDRSNSRNGRARFESPGTEDRDTRDSRYSPRRSALRTDSQFQSPYHQNNR